MNTLAEAVEGIVGDTDILAVIIGFSVLAYDRLVVLRKVQGQPCQLIQDFV